MYILISTNQWRKHLYATVAKVEIQNVDYNDWYEVVVELWCVVLHIIRYGIIWNAFTQISRKEQEAQNA